jgi:hypothetical protein
MYEDMNIDNIAYVWQSHGYGMSMKDLEAWYPGDDYVDWCGYSHFARWEEEKMTRFARRHDKPVFISEASPTIPSASVKETGKAEKMYMQNKEDAEKAWREWFIPFLSKIQSDGDVIKAFSYINCNWKGHDMWKENPTFQNIDARIQNSAVIGPKWSEEMRKDRYLKASEDLFDLLWAAGK